MITESDFEPKANLTLDLMRTFLETGWGELGLRVADHIEAFNEKYFAGELKPLPIVITPASPYGHWWGLTCGCRGNASLIYLTRPKQGERLIADRGVLLHEMIHAVLVQRGEDSSHSGQPWRDEITRIARIAGREIVAMKTKVAKVKQEGGTWKSERQTQPGSLTQKEIATWPSSINLDFGPL